jgi:hypothetical protein
VGRSLGTLAGNFVIEQDNLLKDIQPQEFGNIVAAACLAHDIGNPPFGHSGDNPSWLLSNPGNNSLLTLTSIPVIALLLRLINDSIPSIYRLRVSDGYRQIIYSSLRT